jgi:hypothetical protein
MQKKLKEEEKLAQIKAGEEQGIHLKQLGFNK